MPPIDVLGNEKSATEQLLERAIQANRSAYAAIKGAQAAGAALVWGNADGQGQGPTPQEACDLLDSAAAKWFAVSALSAQIIAILDGVEPQIMPEGWTYRNDLGRIILTRP
jgi:hypothetical protein